MKKILKWLKWMVLTILLLGILLFATGYLLIEFHPVFGGQPNQEVIERKNSSDHFHEGEFINSEKKDLPEWTGSWNVTKKFLLGFTGQFPSDSLPSIQHHSFKGYRQDFLVWFGHSTFFIRLDGKNILFDPMLGDVPAPFDFLGSSRFKTNLPMTIDQMPEIDLVFISHDHYDHLDYKSILKLKAKTKCFVVPLGVEAHLLRWGVDKTKIVSLDWWESEAKETLGFTCVPAHHFSGRAISDHNATLWSGWVLQGQNTTIYHSGDGGFGKHFKAIGQKFDIDYALLECGQYNKNWQDIHMLPEETVQAAKDVQCKYLIPIHWGAFALSLHTWNEPILRVTAEAKKQNQPVIAPKIGALVFLNKKAYSFNDWWTGLN